MASHHDKSRIERLGCQISSWVSDLSAHPYSQLAVIVVCAIWFAVGFATDLLTAILSILAITLAQMVLNRQNEREADAHRRDVAMHAKLDELVVAAKGARNEMVGIEILEEAEIEELKEEVKQAIDEVGEAAGDPGEREAAKKAVDAAASRAKAGVSKGAEKRSRGSQAA